MVISSIGAVLLVAVLLAIVLGSIYLLILAVRAFISRHYLKGVGLLLVLPCIYVLSLTPLTCQRHAAEKARRASCANQVRNFTLFLKMYADDHAGQYPGAFSDLIGPYR